MKLWKFLLPVTLCLVLVLVLLPTTAAAASSGTCGDNVTWTLDDVGTLTISGTGPMKVYISYSSVPWFSNRSSVKKVVIADGVTTIGDEAFYYCTSLTSVTQEFLKVEGRGSSLTQVVQIVFSPSCFTLRQRLLIITTLSREIREMY